MHFLERWQIKIKLQLMEAAVCTGVLTLVYTACSLLVTDEGWRWIFLTIKKQNIWKNQNLKQNCNQ